MAEAKKRTRRDVPPYLSLSDSISLIESIHNTIGDTASADDLVQIFNNPTSSSSFLKKVAALKAWGLITKEGRIYRLLSAAGDIAMPRSTAEKKAAILGCFLNVDNMKRIAENYAGKMLPEGKFFESALKRDLGIEAEKEWAGAFIESGKVAGVFIDIKGRLQVRENFEQSQPQREIMGDQDIKSPTDVLVSDSDRQIPPASPQPEIPGNSRTITWGSVYFKGPRPKEMSEEQADDIRAFKQMFEAAYRDILKSEQSQNEK